MSVKFEELITSLIQSAPSTELPEVIQSLKTISGASKSTIDDALAAYIKNHPIAVSDYIISSLNKDPHSSKYIDYIKEEKFTFDITKQEIVDVESYTPKVSVDSQLVSKLQQYGDDYFQDYAFTIIPESSQDAYTIIILGQKLNQDNFYTGIWHSQYKINGDKITGAIDLDIHYFEDGNVRLKYNEADVSGTGMTSASDVVNFINQADNAIELKLIDQFQHLNQQSFKNLRRLLPVTRSKINWGSAIGNYRLGSDVVNKK
ncbi:CAP1 [Candida margitis]|uniref:CAP1 n=1 Tax=Candida margitis TaxID=1775924 RepID=UPI002227BADB|nr:CAP1 [Candida margitis]KAI5968803.1 CAP1 [Candida margitis]